MYQLSGPSNIIGTLGEKVQVDRDGKVITVDGKPVKVQPVKFPLTCNIQPLMGSELLMVPEGDRYKETYWLYTNETTQALLVSDRVVWQGVNYEVQKVETWGKAPNGYQRAMMVRIDVGPNASPVRQSG